MYKDGKPLKDYGVQDSCKITLVIKKTSTKSVEPTLHKKTEKIWQPELESPVWKNLRAFLQRHFREKDVEAVLKEFKEVYIVVLIYSYGSFRKLL